MSAAPLAHLQLQRTLIDGVLVRVYASNPVRPSAVVLWVEDDTLPLQAHELDTLTSAALVAVTSHRLSTATTDPKDVDDVDRALQWVRSAIAQDGQHIILAGRLDGARIAVELARRVHARGIVEISAVAIDSADVAGLADIHHRVAITPTTADLAVLAREFPNDRDHSPLGHPPAINVDSRVEPSTRAFLDRLARWDSSSIDGIRSSYAALPRTGVEPAPGIRRDDAVILGQGGRPSVPVRWYRPEALDQPAPGLLYLHGGAYIMGTLAENDDRLDQLALQLGCIIVSVDYRLAPEHPFPAGLDDVETVWSHLAAGMETGIDTSRLVVMGSSAGGGLATALCLRLAEGGHPQPILQALAYPMIDDREPPSMAALSGGAGHWGLWHLRSERLAWDAYLGETDRTAPPKTAVPARASTTDLLGLSPAFIGIGDVDALIDSNLQYATQLIAAGVPTELHVYPGVIHGGFTPRPVTAGTRAFLRDAVEAVHRAMHGPRD